MDKETPVSNKKGCGILLATALFFYALGRYETDLRSPKTVESELGSSKSLRVDQPEPAQSTETELAQIARAEPELIPESKKEPRQNTQRVDDLPEQLPREQRQRESEFEKLQKESDARERAEEELKRKSEIIYELISSPSREKIFKFHGGPLNGGYAVIVEQYPKTRFEDGPMGHFWIDPNGLPYSVDKRAQQMLWSNVQEVHRVVLSEQNANSRQWVDLIKAAANTTF